MTGPKTMSDQQLAANRRNAQLSTGPRTPEGKAASRWNALKHGVLARVVIPPALERFESREDFTLLLETFREELSPASALEEMLVERLVTAYWRLGRLLRAESGAVAYHMENAAARFKEDRRRRQLGEDRTVGAHDLENRIQALSLAQGSVAGLRQLLLLPEDQDPKWQAASDQELVQEAEARLAALRDELAQTEARELDTHLALRSAPSSTDAAVLARYETMLERQFYRALQTLERLQRLRSGEPVPPPLIIDVTGSESGDE